MALSTRTKKVITLFLLFTVYLVIGMVVFVAIEGGGHDDGANKQKQKNELKILKERTMSVYRMSSNEYDELYRKIVDTPEAHTEPGWSYQDGFGFVVQVVTTIGYGDHTPRTTLGQVMCMFYALFGIPLCVLFLQAVGEGILKGQRKMLIKLEVSCLKRTGEPRYLNEKCVAMSFLLLIILIFIGAGVQQNLEEWSIIQGVYCYFITFTTIGFGDLIPGYLGGTVMRIIHPLYIILGLVVMSNVLNALVGCSDSIEALKNRCGCGRKETEAGEEKTIMDMKDRSNGGGEAV